MALDQVHWEHDDGQPLCWELDWDGFFEATRDYRKVTCNTCLRNLKRIMETPRD